MSDSCVYPQYQVGRTPMGWGMRVMGSSSLTSRKITATTTISNSSTLSLSLSLSLIPFFLFYELSSQGEDTSHCGATSLETSSGSSMNDRVDRDTLNGGGLASKIVPLNDNDSREGGDIAKISTPALKSKGSASHASSPYTVTSSHVTQLIDPGRIEWKRPSFHTNRYLFPIGFRVRRSYTSVEDPEKRSWYICEIQDGGTGPWYVVYVEDNPSRRFEGPSTTAVWSQIARMVSDGRGEGKSGISVSGPTYYGLNIADIIKVLEYLPDAELCNNYEFRFRDVPGMAPKVISEKKRTDQDTVNLNGRVGKLPRERGEDRNHRHSSRSHPRGRRSRDSILDEEDEEDEALHGISSHANDFDREEWSEKLVNIPPGAHSQESSSHRLFHELRQNSGPKNSSDFGPLALAGYRGRQLSSSALNIPLHVGSAWSVALGQVAEQSSPVHPTYYSGELLSTIADSLFAADSTTSFLESEQGRQLQSLSTRKDMNCASIRSFVAAHEHAQSSSTDKSASLNSNIFVDPLSSTSNQVLNYHDDQYLLGSVFSPFASAAGLGGSTRTALAGPDCGSFHQSQLPISMPRVEESEGGNYARSGLRLLPTAAFLPPQSCGSSSDVGKKEQTPCLSPTGRVSLTDKASSLERLMLPRLSSAAVVNPPLSVSCPQTDSSNSSVVESIVDDLEHLSAVKVDLLSYLSALDREAASVSSDLEHIDASVDLDDADAEHQDQTCTPNDIIGDIIDPNKDTSLLSDSHSLPSSFHIVVESEPVKIASSMTMEVDEKTTESGNQECSVDFHSSDNSKRNAKRAELEKKQQDLVNLKNRIDVSLSELEDVEEKLRSELADVLSFKSHHPRLTPSLLVDHRFRPFASESVFGYGYDPALLREAPLSLFPLPAPTRDEACRSSSLARSGGNKSGNTVVEDSVQLGDLPFSEWDDLFLRFAAERGIDAFIAAYMFLGRIGDSSNSSESDREIRSQPDFSSSPCRHALPSSQFTSDREPAEILERRWATLLYDSSPEADILRRRLGMMQNLSNIDTISKEINESLFSSSPELSPSASIDPSASSLKSCGSQTKSTASFYGASSKPSCVLPSPSEQSCSTLQSLEISDSDLCIARSLLEWTPNLSVVCGSSSFDIFSSCLEGSISGKTSHQQNTDSDSRETSDMQRNVFWSALDLRFPCDSCGYRVGEEFLFRLQTLRPRSAAIGCGRPLSSSAFRALRFANFLAEDPNGPLPPGIHSNSRSGADVRHRRSVGPLLSSFLAPDVEPRQVYEMRFHSQNRADRIAEDVARSKECNVPLESFIQAGIEDPQAFVSTAAHRRNVESRLSSTYLSKVFDLAKVKEESKMSSVPVKGRECTSRQSRRARALRALQTQLLHTYRRDNARFLKRGFENGQCIDDSSSCL